MGDSGGGTSRRQFLKSAGSAVAAFTIVPRHVLGRGATPPSEKLNVACIGVAGRGGASLNGVRRESIVALCDVDTRRAGAAFAKFPQAKVYRDFRKMFDEMGDGIDAVTVATPDHTHAVAAMAAMERGKHVFCEKPLAHSVGEIRALQRAAHEYEVVTQLGNQGHSFNDIRTFCEWIWDGAIGDVHEVHAWTSTGARRWTSLTDLPKEKPPVPAGLDWQRWLEPVPARPYHIDYAPVRWRAWWQFGSGTIGDFACHHLDPAFWALKLNQADSFTVEASSHGTTKETCPAASLIYYDFPARAGMGPVRITWYEGGVMPPRPKELEAGRSMGEHGVLFVGTKGSILGGGWSRSPRLIPETKMRAYKRPAKSLARCAGHHRNWLDACKGKGTASTHFDYAGPLTEFCLMGNVALRAGKKLQFDWKTMKVTNAPEANAFVQPGYREGWTI